MRSRIDLAILMPFALTLMAAGNTKQATIEDTGSTNVAGAILVVNAGGSTKVQPHGAEAHTISLDPHLCDKFFEDLKSAAPLSQLPHAHCMKSISFGSSLYVEFNGERSPDLNCPAPRDSKLGVLQKDVREIMQAAHLQMGGSRSQGGFRK